MNTHAHILHRNRRLRGAEHARRSLGMTLIEIMVVVAIISMVLGGVGLMAFNRFKQAQIENAKKDTIQIQQAVEMYMLQKRNKCPKGLEDLKASGAISRTIKDPWGNDYTIVCPGEKLTVDVISSGPDQEPGTADDIANYLDDAVEEDAKS